MAKPFRPDPNNENPAYWNGILKRQGLGVKLPPLPRKKFGTGKKMVRTSQHVRRRAA